MDHLAHLHFAPTERARQNLLREGIDVATIHVTGNTGHRCVAGRCQPRRAVTIGAGRHAGQRLLLVTAHRRESFGQELLRICQALQALVTRNPDVYVIYAVHPNPNVFDVRSAQPRRHATDPAHGRPGLCAVRSPDASKFPHPDGFWRHPGGSALAGQAGAGAPGAHRASGSHRRRDGEAGRNGSGEDCRGDRTTPGDPALYARMAQVRNPYGDGHAAERIVRVLVRTARQAGRVAGDPRERPVTDAAPSEEVMGAPRVGLADGIGGGPWVR